MREGARAAYRRLRQAVNAVLGALWAAPGALDRRLQLISPRAVFWIALSFNLLLMAPTLGLLALPRTSAFTVDTLTEALSVKVERGGRVPQNWMGPAQALKRADGCTSFEFYQPAETAVQIDLIWGPEGPWLLARNVGDLKIPFGVLSCREGAREIYDAAGWEPFLETAADRTLVLEGDVSLGQLPGSTPDALLRSGKVTASSASLPFRSARAEQQSELVLGDEVRLYADAQARRQASGTAIVRLERADKVFHVVLQAPAAFAQVKRLGVDGGVLVAQAPSIWARIQAQSEWTIMLLIVALSLNILAVTRHYSDSALKRDPGGENARNH